MIGTAIALGVAAGGVLAIANFAPSYCPKLIHAVIPNFLIQQSAKRNFIINDLKQCYTEFNKIRSPFDGNVHLDVTGMNEEEIKEATKEFNERMLSDYDRDQKIKNLNVGIDGANFLQYLEGELNNAQNCYDTDRKTNLQPLIQRVNALYEQLDKLDA